MNDYTKNFSEQTAQKITFLYANLQYTVVYGHMLPEKLQQKFLKRPPQLYHQKNFFHRLIDCLKTFVCEGYPND